MNSRAQGLVFLVNQVTKSIVSRSSLKIFASCWLVDVVNAANLSLMEIKGVNS
jgi:hypothetical protein